MQACNIVKDARDKVPPLGLWRRKKDNTCIGGLLEEEWSIVSLLYTQVSECCCCCCCCAIIAAAIKSNYNHRRLTTFLVSPVAPCSMFGGPGRNHAGIGASVVVHSTCEGSGILDMDVDCVNGARTHEDYRRNECAKRGHTTNG